MSAAITCMAGHATHTGHHNTGPPRRARQRGRPPIQLELNFGQLKETAAHARAASKQNKEGNTK